VIRDARGGLAFLVLFGLIYFRPEWANRVHRLTPKMSRVIAYLALAVGIAFLGDAAVTLISN
jgi:hypothetical protein